MHAAGLAADRSQLTGHVGAAQIPWPKGRSQGRRVGCGQGAAAAVTAFGTRENQGTHLLRQLVGVERRVGLLRAVIVVGINAGALWSQQSLQQDAKLRVVLVHLYEHLRAAASEVQPWCQPRRNQPVNQLRGQEKERIRIHQF